MFPGWDEPVYRATFRLTVTVPENFMAVSNTPVETETPHGDGTKTVTFGRTPRMSSYLVVFVAGELEAVSGVADGVRIRVVTTRGKKEQGRYAVEVAEKLLPYYNEYFGVKYPLPKLDLIAIPGGFGGAMENWGGITFNESILLFDPATSSQDTKETIFSVESHEMAHMWFGDIVTMAWWDNLWLNEGFASWMSSKATDHFNPDWHVWLRANSSKNFVMGRDARSTTHPIQQKVKDAVEANRIFDEITYQKGEAFIRMLEDYLGESDFRSGIRSYMRAHQFSNTTTADLWAALAAASRKPVARIASGWTEQPGFPLVTAKSDCRAGSRTLSLAQERFTVNYPNPTPLTWQVPVSVAGADGRATYTLLAGKTGTAQGGPCGGRVKLNAGNVGYYRVMYEPAMFAELKSSIRELPDADRLNLLGDTWALAEAGREPATDYLELAEALRDETSLALWEEILTRVVSIDELEVGRPGRAGFEAYARGLLGGVFARVGWDAKPGEPKSTEQLRGRLIEALGYLGDQQVIAEARRRFQSFVNRPDSLSPELRAPVFSVVGHYADRDTYERLRKLARETQSVEEKQRFYFALASALDPKLAEEALKLALTDELPREVAPYLLFAVAGQGEHDEMVWRFAQAHLKELTGKLSEFAAVSYVPSLFGIFTDASRADELEAFAKANLPAEAAPDVAKAAEDIRFHAAFKERELPRIEAWVGGRAAGR
jgi:aminopeptidase N